MDIPDELIVDLINEYKEAFVALDQDNDGLVKAADVERMLKTMNQKPTPNEINDIMMTIDPDQKATGFTFIQFIKLMVLVTRYFDREETLRNVFLCFDRNCDGNVNASELHYVLKALKINISRQEIEDVMQELGDVITFNQFCKIFGRYEL